AANDSGSAVKGLATVKIDSARQQLIGLRTAEVSRGAVGGAWRTVGTVAMDETRVRRVNLKFPGFVEQVFVNYTGEKVRKGDPLFSVYSPDLFAAEEELLLAVRSRDALKLQGSSLADDRETLVAAARRRLELLDIPSSEIDRILSSGKSLKSLTLHSPIS